MDKTNWLRKIIIGGIFVIPFTSLIVSNFLLFPYISGKHFAFRLIIEIIAAAWILLAVGDPKYRPRRSFLMWAAIAFTAIVFVADILGENAHKALWSNFERMDGFVNIVHLFLYFLVTSSVLAAEKLWRRFFTVWLGVGLFAALYAVLQLSGAIVISQGGVRVDSIFGNAIYFAAYLLLNMFLIFFLWSRREGEGSEAALIALIGFGLYIVRWLFWIGTGVAWKMAALLLLALSIAGFLIAVRIIRGKSRPALPFEHILFGSITLLSIILIFFTATRGAVLALVAGLGLFGLLLLFGGGNRTARKISIGLITLLIIGGVGFFALKDSPIIKDNRYLGRIASLSLKNEDIQTRFIIWGMALEGAKERPLLGWGQEGFNYVFNEKYDPRLFAREQWFDRAHSMVFDWLVAAGILGLLAYLALLFGALRGIWKKSTNFSFYERSALTALFAAYFVQNISAFDHFATYIITFSLFAYLHFRETEKRAIAPAKSYNIMPYAPAVALVLVFVIWISVFKPVLAGNNLIRAIRPQPEGLAKNLDYFKNVFAAKTLATPEALEQLIHMSSRTVQSQEVSNELKVAYLTLARTEMEKRLKRVPNDARYHLLHGVSLEQFGNYDEAIIHLNKALELSPRKQLIIVELGSAYLNKRDWVKALEYFKQAHELAPQFTEPKVIYAIGAIYAGNDKLAEEILVPIFGTTLYPDERISRAYFTRGQYQKVIAIWEKDIKENPHNGRSYLLLAGAYLESGNKTAAIETINKLIASDPSSAEYGRSLIEQIKSGAGV